MLVPSVTEDYIREVSEDTEGRFTKKLFQEVSRTESRNLGALSILDDFLLNPQARTLSETVSGTSRNNDLENREPTGDRSQSDPHPEVEFSTRPTSNSVDSDTEDTSHRNLRYYVLRQFRSNSFSAIFNIISLELRFLESLIFLLFGKN